MRQEREQVHAERLREWNELNRDYPIPEYFTPFITGVLGTVEDDANADRYTNIGCLGYSDTGKNSLIAMLLQFLEQGTEVLPVNYFESDGTLKPTPYVVSGFDGKVRLWDLRGQGTDRFPSESYLSDMGLKYFDTVLVVTDGCWKAHDTTLLDATQFAGVQDCPHQPRLIR